jgi:hypothetical protein
MSQTPMIRIESAPGPWEGPEYQNSWPVGGTIQGRVRCLPAEAMKTRGVRVGVRWRTEGRGTTDEGFADELVLHEGDLRAGQEYDWPFELELGEGPISYEGNLIRIVWEVVVTVDLPWSHDVEEKLSISVLPDYVVS